MPVIAEFDEYVIRTLEEDDLESSQRGANNHKISKWMFDTFPHPYTRQSAEDWFKICSAQSPRTDFAIARKGEKGVIGSVGLKLQKDMHRRTVEIGYWLAEEEWGKGIVPRAVKTFVAWTFKTMPEIERIESGIFGGNVPSSRVLQKAGFTEEGVRRKKIFKEGVFHDERMFSLLREEWEERQAKQE